MKSAFPKQGSGFRRATPKLDANAKPIRGHFVANLIAKVYRPRLERESIVLPIEAQRRAKAEAKRARKASRSAPLGSPLSTEDV